MNILLIGNLSSVSKETLDLLCAYHRVTIATETALLFKPNKKASVVSISPQGNVVEYLFVSNSFDGVIFFATRGEQAVVVGGSQDRLYTVLESCKIYGVKKVIYVSSTEIYHGGADSSEDYDVVPMSGFAQALKSSEELCRFSGGHYDMNVSILRVPYLYGDNNADTFLGRVISDAKHKNAVCLPGRPEQLCDFIKEEDLANLLNRILEDDGMAPPRTMNVGNETPMRLSDVADMVSKAFPKAKVTYGETEVYPVAASGYVAREEFDWFPYADVTQDFDKIAQGFSGEALPKEKPLKKVYEKIKARSLAVKGIELVLGLVAADLLSRVATSAGFTYVDFRLIYVVIMSSLYGMKMGVISAALACGALFASLMGSLNEWQVIFYNTNNWVPFLAYFTAGSLSGHMREKDSTDLAAQKEEIESLEQNYLSLFELYNSALDNKNEYRRQIMSNRDSFGRIFEITQRLDSLFPETIFGEALIAMEEMLSNNTLAIYDVVSGGERARLTVASREIHHSLEKTFLMEKYQRMADEFAPDTVWFNRELIEGLPHYCAPIYNEDTLIAMIMVYKVNSDQLSAYYLNLFRVLSGLVQSALVRAGNFSKATSVKTYIKDTRILKTDAFEKVYNARVQMRENQQLDFTLVRLVSEEQSIVKLGQAIEQVVRETDIIAQGSDGFICLLLSKTKAEEVQPVFDRLQEQGIRCEVVNELQSMMSGHNGYKVGD